MSYQQKEGQGSAFKNRKKTNERQPDFTGEINVEGKVYWLSIWNKHSDKAGNWLSLSVQEKTFREAKEKAEAAKPVSHGEDFESDSIPF